MVKFLYERAVNYSDVVTIVFGRDELKLDPLVTKGFSEKVAPATNEELAHALGEIRALEQLNGYKLCPTKTCHHQRAILYALLVFIVQRRKVFNLAQAEQLVSILNNHSQQCEIIKFDIANPSTVVLALQQGGEQFPPAQFSAEQLQILDDSIERVIFVGVCLANYLSSEAISVYMITSFGLYLEATKSDIKFIEDLKSWNTENKLMVEVLSKLENFLQGRNNNSKNKNIPEQVIKYAMFLHDFFRDLAAIKASLRDYLSIELNQSTKSYFYETSLSETWRNLSFPFQTFNNTISNSYSLQLYVLNDLIKQTVTGVEKSMLEEMIISFNSVPQKTDNPYHVVIANRGNMTSLKKLLQNIFSLSAHLIEQREQEDLANPANKKKKVSFKLGRGAEVFMEEILNCTRHHDGEEPKKEEPVKKEGEEATQAESPGNDSKTQGSPDSKSISESSQLKSSPVLKASKPDFHQVKYLEFNVDCLASRAIVDELFVSKNQERRRPKVAKGVRDTMPAQSRVKNMAFTTIRNIFNKHGAVEIDTPVFELKETLLGKYGEEGGKLIYDLSDQGGELLSLRYDLTVPFARYLATNNVKKIKRFHIGKVYRRDQPDMNRGRFREFYQCDLDIAGSYESMIPDAEILTIIHEIMSAVDVGKFQIKLCHRMLLEGIVVLSGASLDKFKTICSSIDKLDKEPWEAVASELINEKGINPEAVEKIKTFVQYRGKIDDLLAIFEETKLFANHEGSQKALEELKLVSKYLKILKSYDSITLDMSLARGLDYYTGLIYEVVVEGSKVGSVGAGGRYDNLVGMFGSTEIPCIGLSIGIERIFVLLEEKLKKEGRAIRENETEFLVATIGKNLIDHKLEMLGWLWEHGFKAEILYESAPKPQKQLSFGLESQIPYIIWLGDDEIKNSIVKIKVRSCDLVHLQERGVYCLQTGSLYQDDRAVTCLPERPGRWKGRLPSRGRKERRR